MDGRLNERWGEGRYVPVSVKACTSRCRVAKRTGGHMEERKGG